MSQLETQYSPSTEQGKTILQEINSIPQNYPELAGMDNVVNRIRGLFLAEIRELEQDRTSAPSLNNDRESNRGDTSYQLSSVDQQIKLLQPILKDLLDFCSEVSGIIRAKRFFSLDTENLGGDLNVSEQFNQLREAQLHSLEDELRSLDCTYKKLNKVHYLNGDNDITKLLLKVLKSITEQESDPLAAMPQIHVKNYILVVSANNLTLSLSNIVQENIVQESSFYDALKYYIADLWQPIFNNFENCYRQMSGFNKTETQHNDPAMSGSSGIPSLASDHTTLLKRISYISQALLNQIVAITSTTNPENRWDEIHIGLVPDLERELCKELFIIDPNSEIASNQKGDDEFQWPEEIETQCRSSLDVLIPEEQIRSCTAAFIDDEIESIKFLVEQACVENSFSKDWQGKRFKDIILNILAEYLEKNSASWTSEIAEEAQNLAKRSNPWNEDVGVPCGEVLGLVSDALREDKAVTGLFDLVEKDFRLLDPDKFSHFGPWIILKYYEAHARDAVALGERLKDGDIEKFIENFFNDFSEEVCGWINRTAKGFPKLEAVEQRITDLFKAEINSLRINAISESFNYSKPISCTEVTEKLTDKLPVLCRSLKDLMALPLALNLNYNTAFDSTKEFIDREAVETFLKTLE